MSNISYSDSYFEKNKIYILREAFNTDILPQLIFWAKNKLHDSSNTIEKSSYKDVIQQAILNTKDVAYLKHIGILTNKLIDWICSKLNSDGFLLYLPQIISKCQGSELTSIHQDYPYLPFETIDSLNLILPIYNYFETKTVVGYEINTEPHARNIVHLDKIRDSRKKISELVFPSITYGDVIAHHCLVNHGSDKNETYLNRIILSLQVVSLNIDCTVGIHFAELEKEIWYKKENHELFWNTNISQ